MISGLEGPTGQQAGPSLFNVSESCLLPSVPPPFRHRVIWKSVLDLATGVSTVKALATRAGWSQTAQTCRISFSAVGSRICSPILAHSPFSQSYPIMYQEAHTS